MWKLRDKGWPGEAGHGLALSSAEYPKLPGSPDAERSMSDPDVRVVGFGRGKNGEAGTGGPVTKEHGDKCPRRAEAVTRS